MMLKKKGFTLVELLATIIVLGILIGITIYVTTSVIGRSKKKSYQVTISQIEKNGNNYLIENSNRLFFLTNSTKEYEYQCVIIENLVDYGYLDNNITDSNYTDDDKVSLSDYIYIERDIKTKSITKTLYTGINPEFAPICSKAVMALGDIAFTSNPGFNEWSQYKDITITYRIKNLNDERTIDSYSYNHIYNGTSTYDPNQDTFVNYIKTKKLRVTSNGELNADIKSNNNIITTAKIKIDKIDTTRPVIKLGSYTGDKTIRQKVTIPIEVTDVGSGVNHSTFTKDDIVVTIGNTKITDYTMTKVDDIKYNVAINSDLYNGKIIFTIDKDKVLDNVSNGNIETTIDTGIEFNNTYRITYNANGGVNAPAETTYTYAESGTIALAGSAPTRGCHMFLGWSTNRNAQSATYAPSSAYNRNIKEDVILYAIWKLYKNTISFDANGGRGGQSNNVTATCGENMPAISKTPPSPPKVCSQFAGWYDVRGGTWIPYYTAAGESARKWDKTTDTKLYGGWNDITKVWTESPTSAEGNNYISATLLPAGGEYRAIFEIKPVRLQALFAYLTIPGNFKRGQVISISYDHVRGTCANCHSNYYLDLIIQNATGGWYNRQPASMAYTVFNMASNNVTCNPNATDQTECNHSGNNLTLRATLLSDTPCLVLAYIKTDSYNEYNGKFLIRGIWADNTRIL